MLSGLGSLGEAVAVLMYFLVSAVLVSPSLLYKELQLIESLNQANPAKATQRYKDIKGTLPSEPSKGLYALHRAALEAAIRSNNHDLIRDIILPFTEQTSWLEFLRVEKAELANYLAIYYRRNQQMTLASNGYECALKHADSMQKPTIINNLAVHYRTSGKPKDAQQLLEQHLNKNYEKSVITAFSNNLANVHYDLGNYAQASTLYIKALQAYQAEKQTIEASYVGLNLLNALLIGGEIEAFARYSNTVAEQVKQSNNVEFNTVLKWQQQVFLKITANNAPSDTILQQLTDSLPKLLKSEFANNVELYVALLALPKLQTQLSQYKKPTENDSGKAIKPLKPIALPWCGS